MIKLIVISILVLIVILLIVIKISIEHKIFDDAPREPSEPMTRDDLDDGFYKDLINRD